jgi:hypothetical protein
VQGRVTRGTTGSGEAEDPAAEESCASRSDAEDPAVSDIAGEAGGIGAVSSGGTTRHLRQEPAQWARGP